ncbi:hypothetical protein ARAM_003995 [Aspergillus rambellii]|uniref:Protein ROT1 n=3 Tax=Aspergillus subgen. Nidulantes TaxID=2720870 RepID=A0A0F8UTC8_9EURO|nr:hypothetical protein ARAM_003995 [Aspergillus rambellii]
MLSVYYLVSSLLATAASAGNVADLVGTWTTKSRAVVTGPEFYDPIEDRFIEPNLPGISFSFTADGHYEEAFYRAVANPQEPACPKGIMQWQHGTYTIDANQTLHLTPIAVDGRQLLSDPCVGGLKSVYTRYNQTETYNSFTVSVDPYYDDLRLDLYSFDGAPMHPMYLVYRPPEMLPTMTLNPVTAGKTKRDVTRDSDSPYSVRKLVRREDLVDPDHWLWIGIFMST